MKRSCLSTSFATNVALGFILSRRNEVEPQFRLDLTFYNLKNQSPATSDLDTYIPGDYCLPDVTLTLYYFYFGFGILAPKDDYFYPFSIGSGHFKSMLKTS